MTEKLRIDSPSGPESLKTDPAQAQRLATTGDTGQPAASQPVASQRTEPVTADSVLKYTTDPQGRVKQQDATGNILADERQIDQQQLREQQAETRRILDSGNPTVQNSQSGTDATVQSLQHDQLIQNVRSGSTPSAPAIKSDSPHKIRMRRVEKELVALEDDRSRAAQLSRAQLTAQLHELKEHEARTVGGATPRMPRGLMLQAADAQEKNPEHHLRWINEEAPGKADAAKAIGYEKVPSGEGGRQLGNLALYRMPMEERVKNIVGQRTLNRERMQQFKKDYEEVAEGISRSLKDQHGINIPTEQILSYGSHGEIQGDNR